MSLYAIGDLHFSTTVNKPMNIFGDNWNEYQEKIISNWKVNVKRDDTVVLVGDTSWGINIDEARPDLDIINSLPGKKIFIKGNHDYWWNTITKLNKLYQNMKFLHTNFYTYRDYAICGGRGWICPNDVKFDENDEKIYSREEKRIRISIETAKKSGFDKIIVCMHYPPTNDKFEASIFTKLFDEYRVKKVLYGHLHGREFFKMGLTGVINKTEYVLVSCDYTKFKLIKIMD